MSVNEKQLCRRSKRLNYFFSLDVQTSFSFSFKCTLRQQCDCDSDAISDNNFIMTPSS